MQDVVNQPLNPFPGISWMQQSGSGTPGTTALSSIPFGSILVVVFFIIFVVWVVYSVIAAYHFLRYGHRSWITVPALALHIFVSGFCIITIMSGLQ